MIKGVTCEKDAIIVLALSLVLVAPMAAQAAEIR